MQSLVKKLLACSIALGTHSTFAGVNVNNGNFYIAYTDMFLPTKGLNIDVTRTYNSRSNYVRGFFGVGWSSEIEGYLNFEKSDLTFFEGGGGNVVRFAASGKDSWVNNVYGPQSIKKIGENRKSRISHISPKYKRGRIRQRSIRQRIYIWQIIDELHQYIFAIWIIWHH